MPPGVRQFPRDETSSHLYQPQSHPPADVLREQEAAFARLTQELEAERESIAQKVQQYRVGSETISMNSISSTDDTFQWGGPQDDSLRYTGDESHGLMDSCLHELENRANMNYGEDNMNYMPEDGYTSGGGHGGYPGEFSSYNGGPHHDPYSSGPPRDAPSVHSSHVSLHSTGSNRNNPRQLKLSTSNLGSRTSLPHDQQPPSAGDNYAPYPNHHRNYEDYGGGGSPMPSNGSPRGGPATPTRFTNHYDDYGDSYRNSPLAYGPSSPGRHGNQGPDHYGDQESFENPMQQPPPHLDMSNHSETFRGGPPDDRFNQPEDSFYRQSPMLDNNRYGNGPDNRYNGGQDAHDNYMDYPSDNYRGDVRYSDESFQGHPENGIQRQPEYDGGQPPLVDRYGQPLNESYNGQPLNDSYQESLPHQHHPDNSYQAPPGHHDNRYGDQPLDDSYRGPGDESFRDQPPQEERFQNYGDAYRGRDPNDSYNDQPTNRSFQHDPHDTSYRDDMPPGGYGDDGYPPETDRRHEGLPPVQDDPFADDPFRQKQRSMQHLREEENPYPRGPPSPGSGSDRMGPGSYTDRPPQYDEGQPPYEDDRHQGEPGPPYYDEDVVPADARMLQNQPGDYPDDGRRSPSVNDGTMRWRAPDLQEVIDYLSHPSEAIKANAAGYLTHLSYMDDGIKQKVRGLDGIPLLVDMLNSEYPEVHRNACGALKNLSYGRNNEENKRAVKNAGGIPALIRLLRKTTDIGVQDSVTGVLWNLSSADDLKAPIIDDGMAVLVNVIVIPMSGWDKRGGGAPTLNHQDPWSTVFRNATGVLRNVSSAGPEARKKLRECQGLVDSLVYTLRTATDQNNLDNKPVENCVCTLRNLAFRIQEVEDPKFFEKRTATLKKQKKQEKEETIGCLGRKKNTKKGKAGPNLDLIEQPRLPPTANQYSALWGVDAMRFFLQLLSGSNPVSLEAACGCVQNLAACDWRPALEIRALVRKEKGLPSLVDLLTYEVERVVGAAATALRNLAIDEKNKELVGKYAMKQLISNLPQDNRQKEQTDDTMCAVLACLNEVIPSNQDFAKAFFTDHGLPRLMCIVRNQTRYSPRTVKAAATVLKTLWKFKVLHNDYHGQGYSEKDFHPTLLASSQPGSTISTPYNTLGRPGHGQGYDDTTLSSRPGNAYPNSHGGNNPRMVQGHSNPALDQQDRYMYGSKGGRMEEVPMSDIGPGYAPIDEQRSGRAKPPAGGIALFPNLPPGQQVSQQQLQQSSHHHSQEPLYAKVNKKRHDEMGGGHSPTNMMLGSPEQGDQGADSWV